MVMLLFREKTAFMETSSFERAGKHIANGAWLYKEVTVIIYSWNCQFLVVSMQYALPFNQGVIEPAPGMPNPETDEIDVGTDESGN